VQIVYFVLGNIKNNSLIVKGKFYNFQKLLPEYSRGTAYLASGWLKSNAEEKLLVLIQKLFYILMGFSQDLRSGRLNAR
jgi:hypothetical protein